MFKKARIKLTAWYLLIIMLISIVFSIAFYNLSVRELRRALRRSELRQSLTLTINQIPGANSSQNTVFGDEAEERLKVTLIILNGFIFILAGGAGYFLAGRTLRPIQEMVDEQNDFITNASHELRTPITALRSEIEVSLLEKISTQDAHKLLQSNLEEVINLQRLADDLLKLAQYEKNKTHIKFEKILLSKLLTNVIKKVSPMAKKKGIEIKNNSIEGEINGDETSLCQLFVIILDNAIKYSPKKTTITINAKKVNRFLRVSIKDQGVGIEEKEIAHIFDRFYRGDKSRSKATDGYGLGLSIAKKIVEIHSGTILINSEVKKGTTVMIDLPLES